MTHELDAELETFEAMLPEWLPDNLGRFVLIKGSQVLGPLDTQRDAITIGYQTFGNVPFLTKEVVPDERPLTFTRNIFL